MKLKFALCAATTLACTYAQAITFDIVDLNSHKSLGKIEATSTPDGTVFQPHLTGLPSGLHGLHIHENASCGDSMKGNRTIKGGAAGSHFAKSDKEVRHGMPWDQQSHAGDLPNLYVDANGKANTPVFSHRLKVEDLKGRSIMIHANKDQYTDMPKLGGSGHRIACGVVAQVRR